MPTTDEDRIETDVLIAAPIDHVWDLVTSAEHVGRWFGDAGAEIDLRPGGAMALHWREHGTYHGRVEAVDPPHRFAWRWLSVVGVDEEATPANSTLTEFTLSEVGAGTRVVVVETGFASLDFDPDERTAALRSHTRGWPLELADLAAYAASAETRR
jgi:uncharacterized protein YndB with AHSA1/START domain